MRERRRQDSCGHCHKNRELSLQCPVPLCRRIVALVAEIHFQLTPGSNLKAECSLFPPHTAPSLQLEGYVFLSYWSDWWCLPRSFQGISSLCNKFMSHMKIWEMIQPAVFRWLKDFYNTSVPHLWFEPAEWFIVTSNGLMFTARMLPTTKKKRQKKSCKTFEGSLSLGEGCTEQLWSFTMNW